MSEAPETREDIYYYVEDCVGGLRYMTRTLDLEVHQVLESWYRTDLVQSQIDAAVQEEREACAELVSALETSCVDRSVQMWAKDRAEVIRARGDTDALAERDARIRAGALREAAGLVQQMAEEYADFSITSDEACQQLGQADQAILALIPEKGES